MKTLIATAATLIMMSSQLAYAGKVGTCAKKVPPQTIQASGVYWVPVDRPELSRYSVFSIPSISVQKSNGRVSIQYALPEELTGDLNYMVFEGAEPAAGAPLEMTGAHGTVSCPDANDFTMCETRYRNLSFNPKKRSEFLAELSQTELELQLREAIAQSFCVGAVRQAFSAAAASGGEPCGFLRLSR